MRGKLIPRIRCRKLLFSGFCANHSFGNVFLFGVFRESFRNVEGFLRRAPVVQHCDLLDTGYGAELGAGFFGAKFVVQMLSRVFGKRDSRISALLRTIMNKAVFADIQITGSGSAAPVMRTPISQVILELIQPAEFLFSVTAQLLINLLFNAAQRF